MTFLPRRPVLAGALVVVLGPAFVTSPASAADDAATVEGVSISVDDLDATIDSFATQSVLNLSIDSQTGTVSADSARTALTILIQNELGPRMLGDMGIEPMSDADRDAQFQAVVAQNAVFGELDDRGQAVVTTNVAMFSQMDDIKVDDVADLRDQYETAPLSVGVVCAQLFTAADEQAASDAVDALADGAAFDEVQDRYAAPVVTVADDPAATEPPSTEASDSTEPSDSSDSPASSEPAESSPYQCTPLSNFDSLGAEVTAPLLEARAGEPTVIATDAGSFVLDIGTFDEVVEPLQAVFDAPPASPSGAPGSAGQLLFDGYLATSDVTVNPRYGRWDSLSGSVVTLDSA